MSSFSAKRSVQNISTTSLAFCHAVETESVDIFGLWFWQGIATLWIKAIAEGIVLKTALVAFEDSITKNDLRKRKERNFYFKIEH